MPFDPRNPATYINAKYGNVPSQPDAGTHETGDDPMEDYPYCGFHPGDRPKWLDWLMPAVLIFALLVLLAVAYSARAETPVQSDPAPLSLACEIPGAETIGTVAQKIEASAGTPMAVDHYEIVEGARAVMLAEQIWPGDDDNGEVTALVVMSAERFGNGVRVVFFMNGCLAGFQDLPAAAAAPLRGADGKGLVNPYPEALARHAAARDETWAEMRASLDRMIESLDRADAILDRMIQGLDELDADLAKLEASLGMP